MTWAEVAATLLPDVLSWSRGWPYFLASFAIGYLSGSIPFGVVIARVFGLGDLRKVGSGNIGATNVLRTGNKFAAAGTLAFDMAKGLAPVAALLWIWGDLAAQLAAVGAVLGHLFPVWLRFKGGKGVATFLGVVLGLGPIAGLLACASWLVAAFAFRISSLAALLMTLTVPVWLWLTGERGAIWAALILIVLIWNKHAANIARLVDGTEPKIGK
ncbi:MAG: glycerol-3-phosphate 1-O-acyltransferase PlsY [Pseudomonadota bacterium]